VKSPAERHQDLQPLLLTGPFGNRAVGRPQSELGATSGEAGALTWDSGATWDFLKGFVWGFYMILYDFHRILYDFI